jgi:hypothetical protein
MARWRTDATTSTMRAVLLGKFRSRLAQFPRQPGERNWRVDYYAPKVAALELGAPLVLRGPQIGHQNLPGEPDPRGDYGIEADGRVVRGLAAVRRLGG